MSRVTAVVGFSIALLAGSASEPAAQMGADPARHREAMRRLGFLVGQWEGDGWVLGPQGRQEIRQSEDVRYELDGTILLVEGAARERQGENVGDVVFNAFAVISWSAEKGYAMRSWLADGRAAESTLTVGDGTFSWSLETPVGPMQYSMRLTEDGAWLETGTLTRGGQEMQIIEFRVSKRQP